VSEQTHGSLLCLGLGITLNQITTLVIPPLRAKTINHNMLDQLGVPADHPLRLSQLS
jgi:hypothetical protein